VGVLSTGNEVVNHGDTDTLKYGQIRDSNRPTLFALIEAAGFEAVDLGIATDSANKLEEVIREGLARVDVLVTTGGVSMGEMDLLKPTLEQKMGATIHFGRVLMKPGKPTTFATVALSTPPTNEKLVFALPGNPVSATVTFYLFVLPALRKMAGYKNWALPRLRVELAHTFRLDRRPEYHRAILRPVQPSMGGTSFVASSTGHQQSSRMLSMRGANALLQLPARTDATAELPKGSVVEAILIGQF